MRPAVALGDFGHRSTTGVAIPKLQIVELPFVD